MSIDACIIVYCIYKRICNITYQETAQYRQYVFRVLNVNKEHVKGVKSVRDHPFMTSTRRGEGSGSDGRMWTGEGGPAPCGRPHRKLKLESTDVILSSSHAKKLASFHQNFVFGQKKVEIFLRYKLMT